MNEARRLDKDKLQYSLINPFAEEGLVRVLQYGARKYSPNNYLIGEGLAWTRVINSLRRHLADFEKGIETDEESGELTVDHIQANAHMLAALVRLCPNADDRFKLNKDEEI